MKWKGIIAWVGLLSGGVLSIQSCCKAYCIKKEMTITLKNFDMAEADTLVLVKYEPNGQFNIKKDSISSIHPYGGPSSMRHSIEDIDVQYDWEIKVPGAGRVYRVTDIDIVKKDCNCNPGRYTRISGYKVDGGPIKNQEDIELQK